MSFENVKIFENQVAEFFGSKYAVAFDSCTHGLEAALYLRRITSISVPKRTYISIPFLAKKLQIGLEWRDEDWQDYYEIAPGIFDAAVLWKRNCYIPGSIMGLSFQYQKHLSLGRGGMLLCDNKEDAIELKKLSYDGRLPDIPWREQDIQSFGLHYYMTPETAALGIAKLHEAMNRAPKKWVVTDWPDLTEMSVWNKINEVENE